MSIPVPKRLVKTPEAARILDVSVAYLERDRCKPIPNIPYILLSPRVVRYDLDELMAHLASKVVSTRHSQKETCT